MNMNKIKTMEIEFPINDLAFEVRTRDANWRIEIRPDNGEVSVKESPTTP